VAKNIFPGGTVANLRELGDGGKGSTRTAAIGVAVNAVDRIRGSNLCPDDPEGPYETAQAQITLHTEDESGNVILDRTTTVTCVSGIDNPTKFIATFGPANCAGGVVPDRSSNGKIYTTVTGEAGNLSRTQTIKCRK
jgi:hypothetical protein